VLPIGPVWLSKDFTAYVQCEMACISEEEKWYNEHL